MSALDEIRLREQALRVRLEATFQALGAITYKLKMIEDEKKKYHEKKAALQN